MEPGVTIQVRRAARRPTVGEYVERRLGRGSATMLRNWLLRAFGAGSIGEFWQYWNPVYGYVLGYFVYRPLRRFVPRPIAVWLSFVVCGLALHDLVGWTLARQVRFPEMSLLFALFGAEVVLADYLHLELSSRPLFVRLAVNGGWLLGAWAIARLAVAG